MHWQMCHKGPTVCLFEHSKKKVESENIACHIITCLQILQWQKGNVNYVSYQINNSISPQILIIDWSLAES